MDSGLPRGSFSQCNLDQGAFVYSFFYLRVDACTYWSGRCCLVGDRSDDCVNAGCHLSLCLVFRAHVSPGGLDVRTTAWPRPTDENGMDKLSAYSIVVENGYLSILES